MMYNDLFMLDIPCLNTAALNIEYYWKVPWSHTQKWLSTAKIFQCYMLNYETMRRNIEFFVF